MDGSRRQSSLDRTHSPLLSPAIRIESPTRSPGKPSCLTVFQVREGGGEQGEERKESWGGGHTPQHFSGGGGYTRFIHRSQSASTVELLLLYVGS